MRQQFKFAQIVFFLFSLTAPVRGEETVHTVQRDETFYSIAIFYGVSMDALMRLNNIADPKKLRAGQKLKIPGKISLTTAYTEYTVVRGDTLTGIARKNNITIDALRSANGLSASYTLKAGEKLRVPVTGTKTSGTKESGKPQPVQAPSAKETEPASREPLPKYRNTTWPVPVRSLSKADGKLAGGVILTSYASEPVRSLTQGVVKAAGPYFNFKNVIIVQSKQGYLYTYGGCERLSVKVGDQVGAGTELGRLDTSKEPQLLLMVSTKNNKTVNPETAPRD